MGLLDRDPSVAFRSGLLPYLWRTVTDPGDDITECEQREWALPGLLYDPMRNMARTGAMLTGAAPVDEGVVTQTMLDAPLIGGLLSGATGMVPEGALLGANVWHGGPNRWMPEPGFPQGRPRLDRVGTGEGAQAYGHGFYSAEAKGVAQSYKDDLFQNKGLLTIRRDGKIIAQGDEIPDDVMEAYKYLEAGRDAAGQFPHNTAYYAKQMTGDKKIQRLIDKHVDDTFKYEDKPGTLKKLDIPDEDIAKYLDWDAPLSEQPKHIQKAWAEFKQSELGALADDSLGGNISAGRANFRDPLGKDIYGAFVEGAASKVGPEKFAEKADYKLASEALRKAGIPGLKYYDQMSRGGLHPWGGRVWEEGGKWFGQRQRGGDLKQFGADKAAAKAWEKKQVELRPQTRNYVIWDQDVLNRTRILESGGE